MQVLLLLAWGWGSLNLWGLLCGLTCTRVSVLGEGGAVSGCAPLHQVLEAFAAWAVPWDCVGPCTGWASRLFCLAGVIGCSDFLCCLWPLFGSARWGYSVPVLLINSPS